MKRPTKVLWAMADGIKRFAQCQEGKDLKKLFDGLSEVLGQHRTEGSS